VRFVHGTAQVTPWPFTGPDTLERLVESATDAPAGWPELALRHAGELTALEDGTARVHADLNPKNVLLADTPGGWRAAALLDWEFTFAGPCEVDIGNLLRFEARDRPIAPFGAGVRDGLGGLDETRLRAARALDLLALCGLLTPRSQDHPVRMSVRRLAAHQVATGKI
jgi:Phosphotransferase enzyme family